MTASRSDADMHHRPEAAASLKIRRSCVFAGQKLQVESMFKAEVCSLFQKPGQQSNLTGLGINTEAAPCTYRLSSRSSTGSTLVPADEASAVKQSISSQVPRDLGVPDAIRQSISNSEVLDRFLSQCPQLRAIVIAKKNSWSRLAITQEMFEGLSVRMDIFPEFRETIVFMGMRTTESEVLPPPMRWRSIQGVQNITDTPAWESSYILRYTQLNQRSVTRPWSLRQFAVYEKLSPLDDCSSWVFVDPPEDVVALYPKSNFQGDLPSPEASISTHLAFLNNVTAYFRPYVIYLAGEVAKHSRLINFADPMDEHHVDLAANGTRLKLKILEDDIADTLLALRGNQQVVDALNRMWSCCGVPVGTINEELSITNILSHVSQEIQHLCLQLQTLREKLSGCTQIVSSFSDLSNGESLRCLAVAGRKEYERTTMLSKLTQRDAAAVKALSVIALIYLPTTVVLNFFSTSLIDVSSDKPVLASHWWLFLAISVPLTIITVVAWYLWLLLSKHESKDGKWYRWWSRSRSLTTSSEKV